MQIQQNGDRKKAWMESSKAITEEINGKQIKFYPVSARYFFAMRGLAAPIGKIAGVFSANTRNDVGQKSQKIKDQESEVESLEIEAISTDLALARAKSREDAISEAVVTLTKEENLHLVVSVILDSMKEEFPRGSNDRPSPTEFIDMVEMPALIQMLVATCKANAEVFGDTGKSVAGMVKEKMGTRLAEASGKAAKANESPSQQTETLGSISPTTSNG